MEEEKSYQEIRKNILEKYTTKILPQLTEWENKRKKVSNPFKDIKKILIIIGILLLTGFIVIPAIGVIILVLWTIVPSLLKIDFFDFVHIFFTISSIFEMVSFFIFILYIFISFIKYSTTYYEFQKGVKSFVMPLVCSCFPDLKWVPEKEHLTDIYKAANILPNFDFVTSDDCFTGNYKGINFEIEEVDARVRGKNGSSSVFKGIVLRCKNFNKRFKGHTVIQPAFFSMISSRSKDLHKTEMEDIVFEKKYNVYTNDDVEARYLITPALMEKINNIKTVFKSELVYIAFYCGQFFLSIQCNENLFDYGHLFNSLEDQKPFIKMSEEIISILKLIDYFKLDQNIGM